ncbi:MAG: TonB-dependent receptor [Rhodocyclaceae bacterium]|nr:TonB-dependent receptor [Rhodocyclaceae bacterium]
MTPLNKPTVAACLAAFAVMALAGEVVAQAQTPQWNGPVQIALSERDYFEELPVVLSVSRLAQPLSEAPGAVTVIDREMIRLSGVRHVVDLLRLVPGMQVSPVKGGAPSALYHGLAEDIPRHMQVLLDGRSQYSPFFAGGVNWDLIPVSLDDIDRIEVVRGSNSASYGSNAFLGVVNIVTRHASETLGAAGEMHAGTQGVNDKRLRLGAGGRDVNLRATAETRRDEGFDNFRDRKLQRLIDARADWRLGLGDELQLQAGGIETTQQVGDGSVNDPMRNQTKSHKYVQLGWRHSVAADEDFSLRFYRSEEGATDSFLGKIGAFPVPADYGFSSARDDIEATHTFSPARDMRVVWGGEWRSDAVNAPQYYGTSQDVANTVSRLFGNLEWRFAPALVANLGSSWEYDTNSKTTFAPRAAINWHVAPGQTLRAGASRAYRTPSLFEKRGNWTYKSTSGLTLLRGYFMRGRAQPEIVTSRELGWLGEFRPLGLSGDVRVFEERVADRMIAIRTDLAPPNCVSAPLACGTALDIYNAQDARIRGLEYQFRWQPGDATRVIFNQSFIRIAADMHPPYGQGISGGYFPLPGTNDGLTRDLVQTNNSAPTHATTLMLMQKLPGGLDLSATYHSTGAMKWSGGTYAKHWQRLDWRVGYSFRVGATRGELAFTVQSDGVPHVERAESEVVSRRGFATLRLEY